MSSLYTEVIDSSGIETTIRLYRDTVIKHIRPHIYRESYLPNGDLQLEILEGSDVLMTKTINYVDINALGGAEWTRGFLRYDTDIVLHHDKTQDYTEYTLRIKMINYTPNTSSSINLVTELHTPNTNLYDSFSDFSRGFEIYSTSRY